MVSNQEGQVPVVSSLPPAVDGHLRCFLRVSVPTIQWEINKYPTDVHVQLNWWGEERGTGILFRCVTDAADYKCLSYFVVNWVLIILFVMTVALQ